MQCKYQYESFSHVFIVSAKMVMNGFVVDFVGWTCGLDLWVGLVPGVICKIGFWCIQIVGLMKVFNTQIG